MKATRNLDGYRRVDDATAAMAPQMVLHDGKPHLVVHASGLTTGLVGNKGALRPCVTVWDEPIDGRPCGMALTFTPSDAMLDAIIGSLTKLRDDARTAAADQAAALLRKAAGK